MSKLIKTFRTNYAASLLLISGLTIHAVYLTLCLFTDPTPFAELPVGVKLALALPLFAAMVYVYQHLVATLTGKSKIDQLIEEASHDNK